MVTSMPLPAARWDLVAYGLLVNHAWRWALAPRGAWQLAAAAVALPLGLAFQGPRPPSALLCGGLLLLQQLRQLLEMSSTDADLLLGLVVSGLLGMALPCAMPGTEAFLQLIGAIITLEAL